MILIHNKEFSSFIVNHTITTLLCITYTPILGAWSHALNLLIPSGSLGWYDQYKQAELLDFLIAFSDNLASTL